MKVITARNVNEAYHLGLGLLHRDGVLQSSRAGDVFVINSPVTTAYMSPTERVLFAARRDANPFFHLMESLWMLAGRNDATWLDNFVSSFSKRFAENGGLQHGAYGFRWRNHFILDSCNEEDAIDGVDIEFDQLERVIRLLRQNHLDRRIVLQMWDPEVDLGIDVKDVPCNICALPRINQGNLDLTVFCRSNDAIWGAYGANAVHFSVLQEYMAARIGVRVGTYYQISNNFHAYVEVMKKHYSPNDDMIDPYCEGTATPLNLVDDPETFDTDLKAFFDECSGTIRNDSHQYRNMFFERVALPMFYSYQAWREGNRDLAYDHIFNMPFGNDWRGACLDWYNRRNYRRLLAEAVL